MGSNWKNTKQHLWGLKLNIIEHYYTILLLLQLGVLPGVKQTSPNSYHECGKWCKTDQCANRFIQMKVKSTCIYTNSYRLHKSQPPRHNPSTLDIKCSTVSWIWTVSTFKRDVDVRHNMNRSTWPNARRLMYKTRNMNMTAFHVY